VKIAVCVRGAVNLLKLAAVIAANDRIPAVIVINDVTNGVNVPVGGFRHSLERSSVGPSRRSVPTGASGVNRGVVAARGDKNKNRRGGIKTAAAAVATARGAILVNFFFLPVGKAPILSLPFLNKKPAIATKILFGYANLKLKADPSGRLF
jgi:hypothetical protein